MCHFIFSLLDFSFKYAEAYTDMFSCTCLAVWTHTLPCVHFALYSCIPGDAYILFCLCWCGTVMTDLMHDILYVKCICGYKCIHSRYLGFFFCCTQSRCTSDFPSSRMGCASCCRPLCDIYILLFFSGSTDPAASVEPSIKNPPPLLMIPVL